MITWLNKQLNDNQLSRKQDSVGVFETPQPGAGLRHAPSSHNMVTHTLSHTHTLISVHLINQFNMNEVTCDWLSNVTSLDLCVRAT